MPRTRIKICGITNVSDALLAAEAGADAVGMVFHAASPRGITLDRARDIIRVLPPLVSSVGLFVDATSDHIHHHAIELGLSFIQLHGHETPEMVRAVSPLKVIKAIRVDPLRFESELAAWRTAIQKLELSNLVGLVLETAGGKAVGGTGRPNDWEHIRAVHARGGFTGLPAIIAAGGLNPSNVGAVIQQIRPYAVDVSSGVEGAEKGKKTRAAVTAFCSAVMQVDHELNLEGNTLSINAEEP